MTPEDLRLFCTALGFTAVVMKGDEPMRGDAERALKFAALIESFCLEIAPQTLSSHTQINDLIEQIKSNLQTKGEADMDKDRETLLRLYARLAQRAAQYASNDVIADLALGLIDAEIYYELAHDVRIS